ncbi:MAG: transglutaminase-like domain-containing protein [Archaeoglobaceae archaeon]
MNPRILLVSLALILSLCLSFGEVRREEYCGKVWRYDLECALNKTLSNEEIEKVLSFVDVKGISCVEIAWNTLEWVQKNVRYDVVKASLPPPVITFKGGEVVVQSPERFYQTPEETAKLKKGICGDIAILTTALMLAKNCKSYVAFVEFRNQEVDHLASLVFLDRFYVLDQNLPPMDLGSYYNKWLREGKRIEQITIYDMGVKIGNLTVEDLKSQDREFTKQDLDLLRALIVDEMKKRFSFGNLDRFEQKAVLRMKFEGFADYYSDVFADKIAELIAEKLLEKVDGKWDAFTLEARDNFPDLEIVLTLFKLP